MLLTYRFISLKWYHLVSEHFGVIPGILTDISCHIDLEAECLGVQHATLVPYAGQ